MNVKELEMLYEAALRPIFGDQLHIIHDSDHFVTIILNGNGKIFFLRFMEQIMSAYTGVTNVLFFRPCLKIGGMPDWGRFFCQARRFDAGILTDFKSNQRSPGGKGCPETAF